MADAVSHDSVVQMEASTAALLANAEEHVEMVERAPRDPTSWTAAKRPEKTAEANEREELVKQQVIVCQQKVPTPY